MAEKQPVDDEQGAENEAPENGRDDVSQYEQELADYLQKRIKPGLNSGAIPLLARSIAKDLAHREHPNGTAESAGEQDDEEGELPDFEEEMHELQNELGEDWILSFSVKGDDEWLTAQKEDGSQRLEAPTAAVLLEAVQLINESGGRSG